MFADEMSIFDQCSERREQKAVSERVESDEILWKEDCVINFSSACSRSL